MSAEMRAILIAAACLLAAGCCEKYKCGVPVAEIVVRDQAGALPPGTKVQRGEVIETDMFCRSGIRGDAARCPFWVSGEGTVTVSAPGYKPATVVAERKIDDCGNGLSQQVEVVLVPETSADASVVVVGSALGCG
jgi:hypothetical protein